MSLIARNIVTALIIFCGLGVLACSWPWPTIHIDNSLLGKSVIDEIIRGEAGVGAEELIARKTTAALIKLRGDHSPRSAAESIGFICEQLPSRTCRYMGQQRYSFSYLPKGHPMIGKAKIVTYSIVLFDNEVPNNVDVQKQTVDQ